MRRSVLLIGTALTLAALPAPSEATFTGRNGRIAIAFSGGCVRTLAPAGGDARVVGPCTPAAVPPAIDWSPDGRLLLCDHGTAIWAMRADGSRAHPLPLGGRPGAGTPAFAADGRRLAYTRGGVIRSARLDGSDDRRLRAGSAPAWSPDGRTIAYNAPPGGALRLMDVATGGDLRELARDAGPADWSPDGRALLYATADRTIVAVAPAGDRPPRIIARNGSAPIWSPDGRELAFIRETAGATGRHWTVWRKRIDGPTRRIYASGPFTAPLPGHPSVPVELAWQARPA